MTEDQVVQRCWQAEIHCENREVLEAECNRLGWRIEQVNPVVLGRFLVIYWATDLNCVPPLMPLDAKWVSRYNQPGRAPKTIVPQYTPQTQ